MSQEYAVKIPFIGKDRITSTLSKIRGSVKGFAKSSEKDLKKVNDAISAKSVMKGVLGARVVTAGFAAVENQVRSTVDEFIAYDHAITKASARYGFDKQTKEFKDLSDAAREVGQKTKFMASEAAEGIDFFAKAAIKHTDAIKLIKPTAELAMAADLDIASAADIATDSLGAFKIETSEFAHVADVLAYTANNTNTDLAEMFETIKKSGPVMRMIGGSLEHFSAMVRPMAAAGIKGSIAATSLKNAMLNLSTNSGSAGDALQELGIKTFKVVKGKKEIKELFVILGEIENKLSKKGSSDRAKYMEALFGKEAVAGMEVVLSTGVDNLRKMAQEALEADGYTAELAKKMGESYENKLKTLQSSLVEIGFKVIDQFGDKIPKAIDYLNEKFVSIDAKQVEEKITGIINTGKSVIQTIKDLTPLIKGAAIAWVSYRLAVGAIGAVDVLRNLTSVILKLGILKSNIGVIVSRAGDIPPEIAKSGKSFDSLGGKINAVVGIAGTLVATFTAAYQLGKWLREEFLDKQDAAVREKQETVASAAQVDTDRLRSIEKGEGLSDISAKIKRVDEGIVAARKSSISSENIAGSMLSAIPGMGYENPFVAETQNVVSLIQKKKILESQWMEIAKNEADAISQVTDNTDELMLKLEQINSAMAGEPRDVIDINQRLKVDTNVSFENAPPGTSAKTRVTPAAPEIDRKAMGQN